MSTIGPHESDLSRLLEDLPPAPNSKLARAISGDHFAEVWRKPRTRGSGSTRVLRISGVFGTLVGGWMSLNDAIYWARKEDKKLTEEQAP